MFEQVSISNYIYLFVDNSCSVINIYFQDPQVNCLEDSLLLWTLTQFACTTVLLNLTAYRVHYTKTLDHPDVLTTSTHFYGA